MWLWDRPARRMRPKVGDQFTKRKSLLSAVRPTIDLDTTDVEVYVSKKEMVSYNYLGQRVGRVHGAAPGSVEPIRGCSAARRWAKGLRWSPGVW